MPNQADNRIEELENGKTLKELLLSPDGPVCRKIALNPGLVYQFNCEEIRAGHLKRKLFCPDCPTCQDCRACFF